MYARSMDIKMKYSSIGINQGRRTGGGLGGLNPPPQFWMGGLNTCQPPLILRRFFLGGGLAPLKLI